MHGKQRDQQQTFIMEIQKPTKTKATANQFSHFHRITSFCVCSQEVNTTVLPLKNPSVYLEFNFASVVQLVSSQLIQDILGERTDMDPEG